MRPCLHYHCHGKVVDHSTDYAPSSWGFSFSESKSYFDLTTLLKTDVQATHFKRFYNYNNTCENAWVTVLGGCISSISSCFYPTPYNMLGTRQCSAQRSSRDSISDNTRPTKLDDYSTSTDTHDSSWSSRSQVQTRGNSGQCR